MRNLLRTMSLLAAAGFCTLLHGYQQTVFSFDDAAGVKAAIVRSGVTMTVEQWPDAFFGACARLDFAAYHPGQERWPAVILCKPYLDGDWSSAVEVGFDVYSETGGMLRMHFNSNHGTVHRVFQVEPGRSRLAVMLEEGTVAEDFHILMEDPAAEATFWVGDISVEIVDFLDRADAVLAEIFPEYITQELKDAYAALAAAVDHGTTQAKLEALARFNECAETARVAMQDAALAELSGNVPVQIFCADASEKIHRDRQIFVSEPALKAELSAAGNESEAFQVAIRGRSDLRNVRVTLSGNPVNGDGVELDAANFTVQPVGYVWCDKPAYPVPRTGWWPDPILNYAESVDAEAGMWQPFWVEVHVPAGQAPGVYEGKLNCTADGETIGEVGFSLTVRGFSLPKGIPYQSVYAVDSDPQNVPILGGNPQSWIAAIKQLMREHLANPGNLYNWLAPGAEEGKAIVDAGFLSFSTLYGHPGTEDYLQGLFASYKNAGIAENAYVYAADEALPDSFAQWAQTFAAIKAKAPSAKILTTAQDKTLGNDSPLGGVVDMFCAMLDKYEAMTHEIEAARAAGREVWYYVACAPLPPYPNFFIEDFGVAPRLVTGAMAWKYRPDGFLYYSAALWSASGHRDSLGSRPLMSGAPLTDWNGSAYSNFNGDGVLVYPGSKGPLASIRLKMIRDGVEDYWYWKLLADALADSDDMPEEWREAALAELEVSQDAVVSMTVWAVSPAALNEQRARIAELLDAYRTKHVAK